jgi:hypothetical protein
MVRGLKVMFKKGRCCLSCGFGQKAFKEVIDGDVVTGEYESGLKDGMKGGCWRIWRSAELGEKYLFDCLDECRSLEQFKVWLGRMDLSREMINGCRVMLRVYVDLYD